MKKLFIVLAVASLGFAACNNEAESKTETDSTATVAPDTTTPPPAAPDTTMAPADTTKADTTKK